MNELQSLGLVGDGDEVNILVDVEECFGFEISQAEAERLYNVGDMYDLILGRLGEARAPQSCFSSHVFYSLRKSLKNRTPEPIGLETPIRALTSKKDDNGLWPYLENQTHLSLPSLTFGPRYLFSLILAIVCFFLFSFGFLWIGLGGLFVGITGVLFFQKTDFRYVPFSRHATLRDLTEKMVDLNFGRLTGKLGGYRETDAWNLLTRILADNSNVDPQTIGRDTLFLLE